MNKVYAGLGIVLLILAIVCLYVGIFSILIYLLSFITFINIEINSWISLFQFSFLMILWVFPYILINIFQVIDLKSKTGKRLIKLISEIVSVILFTLYIIFLDNHFVHLTFSKIGLIFLITLTLGLTIFINAFGEKLKQS